MDINKICKELKKRGITETQGFDSYKIDLRRSLTNKGIHGGRMFTKEVITEFIKPLLSDLNDTVIFNIDKENIIKDNKICIVPFNKMFINSQVLFPFGDELYSTYGYLIKDFDDEFLMFSFVWGRIIHDGWKPINCLIKKKALWKNKIDYDSSEWGLPEEVADYFMYEFKNLFLSLITKIEKKEYTSYKKWTPRGYVNGEIIFDKDVRKHKRHFWKDSGRFKIPLLTKNEWEKRGYGTHEVVYRDGELRRDVPYLVIGERRKEVKKNIVYNLYSKRILRCEEKIYSILREIYPDKIIRRHDRKTLNGIELDFNISELRLGIEYDGEQHFDKELYEKLYGGGFDEQVKRDRQKDKECRRKNIRLVRIKFDEPLTIRHIRNKLK
jgi:hypothetical protein